MPDFGRRNTYLCTRKKRTDMAKNFFYRYVWLIDTIQRYGYITFPEISSLWQKSALNEDRTPLPERTFFNHREAILDIFGIEIKFDKSLGYYLPNNVSDVQGIRDWLLTSLSVNNLINESADLRERILFEEWSIFSYRMAHTWDLEHELLQYNDQVEVLAPQSLRDMIIEHAWNLLHLYHEA